MRYAPQLRKTRIEAQHVLELKRTKRIEKLTYPEVQFLKMCNKFCEKSLVIADGNNANMEVELHTMENGGNIKNPMV